MKRGDKVYFIRKGIVMMGEISYQLGNVIEVLVEKRYRKIYKLKRSEIATMLDV